MNSTSLQCHEEKAGNEIPNDWDVYKIGFASFEQDPSKEKYKNMLHLVAYDIREPSRLRKVAKTCLDFGLRVEYSVFECDLSEQHFAKLWDRLAKIIDPEEDCILAYRICGRCVTEIKSMGDIVRPGKPLIYII